MNTKTWNSAQKIGFRFLFIFFILLISPWYLIPFVGDYLSEYAYIPSFLVQNYLLRMHEQPVWTHAPTGSGDTIDDWVLVLTWMVVAVVGCLVWSLLERKRTNYSVLNYWLRVALRYYLAIILFGYGFYKLVPLQMPFPNLAQLHTPVGDLSPMRLAWLFIGYSVPYEFFAGLMETTVGLLLSFRRTQLLGALLGLATMGNVVMFNYCYDIPVKLFSSWLFLMILYIALYHWKRLVNFFLLNRVAEPAELGPDFTMKRNKIIRWSLLGIFWVFGFGDTARTTYNMWKEKQAVKQFPLLGSYDVTEFSKNGRTLGSPVDTLRWNQLVFGNGFQPNQGSAMIKRGTIVFDRGFVTIDSLNNLTMAFRNDTTKNFKGWYEKRSDLDLLLTGVVRKDSLKLHAVKLERQFALERKPFHWVSAFPY